MDSNLENDQTLPSVVAALRGQDSEPGLVLTIAYHADLSRVGDSLVLSGGQRWLLGRQLLAFGRGSGSDVGEPLNDPHVSRRALELCYDGSALNVTRLPESSRCRVAGLELEGSRRLERDELARGVVVMLGHSVVLVISLRQMSQSDSATQLPAMEMLGGSAYMTGLRAQVARAADSDLDVLILGETGTGKELVAAALHSESRRRDAQLVSVNMSAIPGELAAAALFGSARGAFTGADRAAAGYFQRAEGGTLFLDEIGDAAADVQPQLLRALEQREIQAVGGQIKRVDVRVVSATDADLDDAACDFKAALRHRLEGFRIQLAPLREHREDIGELLLSFVGEELQRLGREQLLPDEHSRPLEVAAWAQLFHDFALYDWPGNIRQLRNFAVEVAHASEGRLVVPEHILDEILEPPAESASAVRSEPPGSTRSMRDVSPAEFAKAYVASDYGVAETARVLRVSRNAVYRRLEKTPDYRVAVQVPEEELVRALQATGGDVEAAALQLRVSAAGLRTRLHGSSIEWH
jgi:two-component system nitrogen regulation response regulator GlnG